MDIIGSGLGQAQAVPVGTEVKASVVGCTTQEVDNVQEVWTTLRFTWSGKALTLDIAESDRVYDLKQALQDLTNVPPERQKILGLVRGKLPPDEELIGHLKLVSGKKFTLVGTAIGDELKEPEIDFFADAADDAEKHDFWGNTTALQPYANDRRNIRKVKEVSANLKVNIMYPLREGKKLLVLDIDYTIVDTRPLVDGALPPLECVRPRLHEFLEAIYPYYDICIWSQTSWYWLETKLVELGMVGSDRNYKISFVLDKKSMFTVFSSRNSEQYKHSVKALQIIWNSFPQFSAKNTIHVDDLGRNFALNPGEGLKISQFRDAHTTHAQRDRELERVAQYMVHIAPITDLRNVDHKMWKSVVKSLTSSLPPSAPRGPS